MDSTGAANATEMRTHSRVSSNASHDNESEYSVNLDALPHSAHNDSTFDLSQANRDLIDVVRTDDIDGPTDFTQNLEYWMRLKLPNVLEPTTLEGQGKKDLEQYISSEEGLSSVTDTPQTPRETTADPAQVTAEADIKGTIERQSMKVVSIYDDEDQENDSHIELFGAVPNVDGPGDEEYDKHSHPSPSHRSRSRLQPSVEDHEDSPSQLRAARATSASRLRDNPRHSKHGRRGSGTHRRRSYDSSDRSYDSSDQTHRQRKEAQIPVASGKSYAQALGDNHSAESTHVANQHHHRAEQFSSASSTNQNMVVLRLREELEKVRRESENDLQGLTQEHENELVQERKSWREHDSHSSAKITSLEKSLEDERKRSERHVEQHQMLSQKASRLQQDLASSRQSLEQLRGELNHLQSLNAQKFVDQVRDSQQHAEKLEKNHKAKLAALQRELGDSANQKSTNHVTDLEHRLTEAKIQISGDEQKITDLQNKLADRDNSLHLAEQRAMEAESSVEESGQIHREELRHEQELHDVQVSALEEQADSLNKQIKKSHQDLIDTKRDLHEAQSALQQSRHNLAEQGEYSKRLKEESETLHNEALIAVERRQASNSKVAMVKEQHARDLTRIQAVHTQEKLETNKIAEAAVLKMRNLLDKQRKELGLLRKQAQQSRKSEENDHAELENLRNEIRIANDHVEDTERERDDLKCEIAKMDQAMEAMLFEARKAKEKLVHTQRDIQTTREENEAINDTVLAKVTDAVQAKEREWKHKIIELEREIEIRSKLLMIEWGRSEVGHSDPQPYKYKYLAEQMRRS